jgi:hypothetical protein
MTKTVTEFLAGLPQPLPENVVVPPQVRPTFFKVMILQAI